MVDSTTEELCLPIVLKNLPSVTSYDIITIDPGEENKNIDFCIGIWKMLLDFEADRNSLLLNVGGGVVTDMGSFAAATFKRGIAFVHVPTTLLSQVDASVGGKTGIDMDEVKNCIGTFTQPQAVVIDPIFLQTLPASHLCPYWRSNRYLKRQHLVSWKVDSSFQGAALHRLDLVQIHSLVVAN